MLPGTGAPAPFRSGGRRTAYLATGPVQQIKVLERELGTPLIHRGTKAITLTTAGEVLREQGGRVLAEARLCVERVRAAAEQPAGVLRVAYTRSGADLNMHELVERFRVCYPSVRLSLSTAWTSRNLELLEAGEVDVAFVRSTVRHRAPESLVVATEELVVAMADGHPLAARERVSFDDVIDLPLVHWPRAQGPGYHDEIRRQIWGDRPQRVALEQPDAEHILREVAGRAGIVVLDEHRARKLCPPGVRVRRFTEPVPTTTLVVTWGAVSGGDDSRGGDGVLNLDTVARQSAEAVRCRRARRYRMLITPGENVY